MFEKLKNKKILKKFLTEIKNNQYSEKEKREKLETLPTCVIVEIAKKIIFADCDGYNNIAKNTELLYFCNLDLWQKKFYVYQRLYKLT